MLAFLRERFLTRAAPPPQPRQPSTEHDYRRLCWGHNIEGLRRIGETEKYTACGFGSNVKVGDTLLLKMESGKDARWRFVEVRFFGDPQGMFSMTIEPVEYLDGSK